MKKFTVIPLILFFLIMIYLFFKKDYRANTITNEIFTKKLITDYYKDYAEKAIKILVKDTKFENKWQINKPIKRDFINLYLLVPGFNRQFGISKNLKKFINNCTFLGEANVIICDTWFIDNFIQKRNISNTNDFIIPDRRLENKYLFFLWVLGHEIGHIFYHHSISHFESNQLEDIVNNSYYYQIKEFEADEFLVTVIKKNGEEFKDDILYTLIDILNSEISFKQFNYYPKPIDEAQLSISNEAKINYSKKDSHPEYIIRIARIIDKIAKLPFPANQLLQDNINNFVKYIREES